MKARIINKTYDLPKLTMAVNTRFEEFDEIREKFKKGECKASEVYRAEYDLLSYLLGEEATCEILLADNLEDVDLTQLSIALIDVRSAYDKPVFDKSMEQFKSQYREVSKEFNTINGITSKL